MLTLFSALLFGIPMDASLLTVPVVHAAEIVWTKELVYELADQQAELYKLNANHLKATLNCEVKKNEDKTWDVKGQSNHPNVQKMPEWYTLQGNPENEQSFGVAQINLPAWPDVTLEQAQNPAFAVPWMAQLWADGGHKHWSCWKLLNAQFGNGEWPT